MVGGMAMHLNRAAASSDLRMVYCNHEQAAVASADGYSKASNFAVPGLAIVTSGPGVSNTVTSLASAFFDSVPVILLSGQIKTADLNRYSVRSYGAQEVPHTEILRPITKLSFLYDPAVIDNADLARHIALSMTGRKGPVHIDVPLDVQAMDVKSNFDVQEVVQLYFSHLERDANQSVDFSPELVSGLKLSQRLLIVLGNGLKIASVPRDTIESMVNRLGIPVLLTWASMDLLSHGHPLVFGCAGGLAGVHSNRILQSADFILFLGTRLDLLTTGFNPASYGKNAKRYVFDCDQAELDKFATVDGIERVLCDVRAVVRELSTIDLDLQRNAALWVAQCGSWRAENQLAEDLEFSDKCLNTYHVASLISSSATTRYVVPTASGYAIEGFARFFKPVQDSHFAWAGHVLGSMGLAIPSAIGASARLKQCVACVDGDGGFLLNMQELYTLRANPDLPIAIFILNNKGYASISVSQTRAFQKNFGSSIDSGLADIDFSILAQIGSLEYIECRTYDSLRSVVNGLSSNSRVLVNIFLDDEIYRGPSITTKFDENGRPYSTELGDVAWR